MQHLPPYRSEVRGDPCASFESVIEENSASHVFVLAACAATRQRWADLIASQGYAVSSFCKPSEMLQVPRPYGPLCVIQQYNGGMLPDTELQNFLVAEMVMPAWLLLVGEHAPVTAAVAAMRAGAFDVLTYDIADQVLLESVDEAIAHQRSARQTAIPRTIATNLYATLTPRERQVFALVCEGKRNRDMAALLTLSETSVKMHRSNVMRKMQVRTLADLVRIADLLG